MKRIPSFFLTPRATAHINNNILTIAILEYKSPFFEQFDHSNLYY